MPKWDHRTRVQELLGGTIEQANTHAENHSPQRRFVRLRFFRSRGGSAGGGLSNRATEGDSHDLALAGKYRQYSKQFPDDVNFVVGKSEAKQDWPYIHPGPADAWAGSTAHPFKINFQIAKVEEGYYRLVVDYNATHPTDPPTVAVDINGQQFERKLPAGEARTALDNLKAGKSYSLEQLIPPAMLHAGDNSITLTNVSGSWAVYDDVRLESGVAAPRRP